MPTIQDGDVVAYESKAILRYLDVAYPENPLFPLDLKQRAIIEVLKSQESLNLILKL